MPRPKTPEGKRVTISARVTEQTAAAVDEHRGTVTRARWLEALIAAAIDGQPAPVPQAAPKRAPGKTAASPAGPARTTAPHSPRCTCGVCTIARTP